MEEVLSFQFFEKIKHFREKFVMTKFEELWIINIVFLRLQSRLTYSNLRGLALKFGHYKFSSKRLHFFKKQKKQNLLNKKQLEALCCSAALTVFHPLIHNTSKLKIPTYLILNPHLLLSDFENWLISRNQFSEWPFFLNLFFRNSIFRISGATRTFPQGGGLKKSSRVQGRML